MIAACVSETTAADWDYLKWLPHAGLPQRRDALGPARLIRDRLSDLEVLLAGVPPAGPPRHRRHRRWGSDRREGGRGRTLHHRPGPGAGAARPNRDDSGRYLQTDACWRTRTTSGTPDYVDDRRGDGAGSALAPLLDPDGTRPPASSLARRHFPACSDSTIRTPLASAIATARRRNVPGGRPGCRIPIGVRADGVPLHLDLKEAARDGMGPHGLLIGATLDPASRSCSGRSCSASRQRTTRSRSTSC